MRSFTLTQLGKAWSDVRHAASKAPVTLTENGKRRFILMSAEDYDHLAGRVNGSRRVISLLDPPDNIRDLMLREIEREIGPEGREP